MKKIIFLLFISVVTFAQFKFQRCLPDRYYTLYIAGDDGVARNTAYNGTAITANGIYKADSAKFGRKCLGINGEVSTQFYTEGAIYDPLNYDFTMELWAMATKAGYANNGTWRYMIGNGYRTGYQPIQFSFNNYGLYEINIYNSNSSNNSWVFDSYSYNTLANKMPLYTWVHIAESRKGDSVFVFVNGKLEIKAYVSGAFGANQDYNMYFGGLPGLAPHYQNGFVGLMQHIRFTKGVARYTSNFVPNKP